MNNVNTDMNNPAPHFAATGRKIVIGDNGYSHRWTHLYAPSTEAMAWDGADARTTHCIGSRHGGYGYVQVKVTGRTDTTVPGIDGLARKIRITLMMGTMDEETVSGWLIGGGSLK